MAQITYQDKSAVNVNNDVADVNKVNATDMNEIKSVVNTNATALDNLTTQVNNKNILTIKLNSNYTIAQTNTLYQITGWEIDSQIGTGLSLSNDKIVIGAGISKIKVSYSAKCQGVNTTRTFVYLTYNSTAISQEMATYGAANAQMTVGLTPRLMSVNENDTFGLSCYGVQNVIILGASSTYVPTILTIEAE